MSGAEGQSETDVASIDGSLDEIGAEVAGRTRENHRLRSRDGPGLLREVRFEIYVVGRSMVRRQDDGPLDSHACGGAAASTSEQVTGTWNASGERSDRHDCYDGQHRA